MMKIVKCFINSHNQVVMTLTNNKGFVTQLAYDIETKQVSFAAREVVISIGYSEDVALTALMANVPENEKCKLAIGGSKGNQDKLCFTEMGIHNFLDNRRKSKKYKYIAQDYRLWIEKEILPKLPALISDIEETLNNTGNLTNVVETFRKLIKDKLDLQENIKELQALIGMYQSMIDA